MSIASAFSPIDAAPEYVATADKPLCVFVSGDSPHVSMLLCELERGAQLQHVDVLAALAGATAEVLAAHPEVVLVEVRELRGIDVLPVVAGLIATVVVSAEPAEIVLLPCLAAGARGFVAKPEAVDALRTAVAHVATGHTYVDPASADWLVESPSARDRNAPHQAEARGPGSHGGRRRSSCWWRRGGPTPRSPPSSA